MMIRRSCYLFYRQCAAPFSGRGWGNTTAAKAVEAFMRRCFRQHAVVQGHRMLIDPHDNLGLFRNGVYEPYETEVINDRIKPGDVVLDIGANIGYYTLMFARRVGPQGRVYAFEPERSNFQILQRNVKLNGLTNVALFNMAVSDAVGEGRLFLADNTGDHRIYDPGDNRECTRVDMTSIDACLLGREDHIDVVKIDTQGSELNVIRGMSNLLDRSSQVTMCVEFAPRMIEECGHRPEGLLEMLTDYGFTISRLDEQTDSVLPVVLDQPIEQWMPTRRCYANLLCVKS